MRRLRALAHVGPALAGRPDLWPVAAVTAVRLAPERWWRRWPPLPVPDASYWRFRMTTAYGGSGDAVPAGKDVVEYLEWCRESHRARGRLR
jgi:hypothetical protein